MESIRPALATLRLSVPQRTSRASAPYLYYYRSLHSTATRCATPLPHPSVPGPPPETPEPAPSDALHRVARKRKQAELLKHAQEARAATGTGPAKPKTVLQKRFWKDVSVKETPGEPYFGHSCSAVALDLALINVRFTSNQRVYKSTSILDRFARLPRKSSPFLRPNHSWPRPLPSNGISSSAHSRHSRHT